MPQERRPGWISVFIDSLFSHATQWWVWVWVVGSILTIKYAPNPLSVIGWIALALFFVYFIAITVAAQGLSEVPEDMWDPMRPDKKD